MAIKTFWFFLSLSLNISYVACQLFFSISLSNILCVAYQTFWSVCLSLLNIPCVPYQLFCFVSLFISLCLPLSLSVSISHKHIHKHTLKQTHTCTYIQKHTHTHNTHTQNAPSSLTVTLQQVWYTLTKLSKSHSLRSHKHTPTFLLTVPRASPRNSPPTLENQARHKSSLSLSLSHPPPHPHPNTHTPLHPQPESRSQAHTTPLPWRQEEGGLGHSWGRGVAREKQIFKLCSHDNGQRMTQHLQ